MRTAAEIASLVRSGRIAAVDVVASALTRATSSQPVLNAYTLIDEGAIDRARAVDAAIARGEDPGHLAGVPVALKDLIDQAGLPNTRGSAMPPTVPATSAVVVNRLEAQGAVIIGRTGLHEFAFGFTSENPWFGPVRNPWNTETAAGGSSGGSAVAVADGSVPIAIGTDTGGSVRVPAALCGVFGLKMTHGRVPLTGVFPLVPSLDTVGPLARSIDDLTLAYLTMAGDDPSDPWAQPEDVVGPRSISAEDVTIGVVREWFHQPLDRQIESDLTRFVADATDAGFTFVEVSDEALIPIPATTMASRAEVLRIHGEHFTARPEDFGSDLRIRLEESQRVTIDDLVDAAAWVSRARAAVERLRRRGISALVAPTVGVRAKTIGVDDVVVNGEPVFHRIPLSTFTAPINAIGLPALAAPLRHTGAPPTSVQLIGSMFDEATLLAVAAALEDAGLLGSTMPPTLDRTHE